MTTPSAFRPRTLTWIVVALLSISVAACADTPTSTPDPIVTPQPETTLPSPLTWSAAAPGPTALYEGQGAAVGGKLYVFGGFFENLDDQPIATTLAHVYDPVTNQWSSRRDIPEAVTHAGTAVDGTTIYVAGGFLGDHPGPQTDHVWKYDTLTDTWTPMPALPSARGAGALIRLNRELHYFGGTERTADGDYRWDDGEHWVLNLDEPTTWQARAPLPNARNHLGAAVLGGMIYAVGGQHLGDEAYSDLTDVDRYDPATNSWTAMTPLPLPLGHITASTVVWAGHIVVAGGVTRATSSGAIEGKESDAVLAYDPGLNEWSALTSLPGPRQSPVADVIGGKLIVAGGAVSDGPVNSTFVGQ